MTMPRNMWGLMLAGGAILAAAPAWSAPDPVEAQFACDLTGDCATSPEAAPAATTPGRPAPRGSATRGFSFRRGAADGTTPPAGVTPPVETAARPVRPARVGSVDLGLDFMPASAALTEGAKARLNRYAAALQSPRLGTRRLRIEGYTDAAGAAKANQVLSQRRAQAVVDYLVQAGVDRSRLEAIGGGSARPMPNVAPQAATKARVMAVLL